MRQKRLLRIELSRGTGGSVYVGVSPSECVLSIKHKLETLTGIPIPSQTLYHAATQLSDSTPLHEFCGSTPVTNLALHVPIRGGACNHPTTPTPLVFQDVTNADCFESLKFDAHGPDYCIVDKGLNFEAKCINPECISVQNSHCVYVQKGMFNEETGGYCSIRREIEEMNCPACNWTIPACNWKNIVFTNCAVTIEWLLSDQSSCGSTEFIVGKDSYTRAKTTCELKEYAYLDVKMK